MKGTGQRKADFTVHGNLLKQINSQKKINKQNKEKVTSFNTLNSRTKLSSEEQNPSFNFKINSKIFAVPTNMKKVYFHQRHQSYNPPPNEHKIKHLKKISVNYTDDENPHHNDTYKAVRSSPGVSSSKNNSLSSSQKGHLIDYSSFTLVGHNHPNHNINNYKFAHQISETPSTNPSNSKNPAFNKENNHLFVKVKRIETDISAAETEEEENQNKLRNDNSCPQKGKDIFTFNKNRPHSSKLGTKPKTEEKKGTKKNSKIFTNHQRILRELQRASEKNSITKVLRDKKQQSLTKPQRIGAIGLNGNNQVLQFNPIGKVMKIGKEMRRPELNRTEIVEDLNNITANDHLNKSNITEYGISKASQDHRDLGLYTQQIKEKKHPTPNDNSKPKLQSPLYPEPFGPSKRYNNFFKKYKTKDTTPTSKAKRTPTTKQQHQIPNTMKICTNSIHIQGTPAHTSHTQTHHHPSHKNTDSEYSMQQPQQPQNKHTGYSQQQHVQHMQHVPHTQFSEYKNSIASATSASASHAHGGNNYRRDHRFNSKNPPKPVRFSYCERHSKAPSIQNSIQNSINNSMNNSMNNSNNNSFIQLNKEGVTNDVSKQVNRNTNAKTSAANSPPGEALEKEKEKRKNSDDKDGLNNIFINNLVENPHLIVTKYAYYTKVGMVPSNPYKVNQDAFIVAPKLNNIQNQHMFAVADGHGQYGREVSTVIKQKLPIYLESGLKDSEISEAFIQSFYLVNVEIQNAVYDINFSGSTLVSLLIKGQTLYTANVGDSRAILCSFENGVVKGKAISRDHKPDEPDEAERILTNGGRIEPFKDINGDHIGPLRVWLKNEDIPGLAMTRSMGDIAGSMAGVIAEPEIFQFRLSKNDKFIVIASDGVWEFLSNNDVAKIIWPFYEKNNAEGAADALVKEAFKRWRREEEIIDDITCVIIFMEQYLLS